MAFNIIVGFLIPWILGAYICIKEKRLFLTVYPFGCTVSYTINVLGFYFKFWDISPYGHGVFVSLPMNLGLYPIVGTYFAFLLYKGVGKTYYLLFMFTLITTLFEYLMVFLGKGVYGHGWNLFWTFVSYLVAYVLAYWFYHLVRSKGILL